MRLVACGPTLTRSGWAEVAGLGAAALVVVKVDVAGGPGSEFVDGGGGVPVKVFVFEDRPEALGAGIAERTLLGKLLNTLPRTLPTRSSPVQQDRLRRCTRREDSKNPSDRPDRNPSPLPRRQPSFTRRTGERLGNSNPLLRTTSGDRERCVGHVASLSYHQTEVFRRAGDR